VARDGRTAAPATAPTAERDGRPHRSTERRGRGERARQPLRTQRAPAVAQDRRRVEAARLLGVEPRRDHPGRRRDWQTVWAALERLANHHRGREDRYRPQERADRSHGRVLGRQERDGR
jgi:hypothetical protein